MSTHKWATWLFGGLMGLSLIAIPACQSTSKEEPQAFSGQSADADQQTATRGSTWLERKR